MPIPAWLMAAENFFGKIPNVLKVGGSLLATGMNQANRQSVGGNMEEQIQTGLKYGIHPLESIGGNISSTPAIPMQNPFAGIQPPEKVDMVEEETKRLVLENLREEAKYSTSLLVGPVSVYPGGKKEYWGFNQKFHAWGIFANTLVTAANADKIYEDIKAKLGRQRAEEFKEAWQKQQRNYQKPTVPGGPQP